MTDDIFRGTALLVLAGCAIAAFALGLVVGLIKAEGRRALGRAFEAMVLCFAGGLLARLFIGALLSTAADVAEVGLLIGWGFFFWPGVIDTLAWPFGAQLLTGSSTLLWIATGLGAFTGMMDGLWRIHRWKGAGVLTFLLDVTWGLGGIANGALLHLVNFAWAGHADEPRTAAHRYRSGFRFKSGFAFTQGAVMSNNTDGPGTALYNHERVHIWQNRTFGPLFTLTYLGWMAIMFLPGVIVGAATGAGLGKGIEQYCYFNNPWEAWAYRVGHHHGGGARTSWGGLIWSDGLVLAASILFFGAVLGLIALTVSTVWI